MARSDTREPAGAVPYPPDPEGDLVMALLEARSVWIASLGPKGRPTAMQHRLLVEALGDVVRAWEHYLDLAVMHGEGTTGWSLYRRAAEYRAEEGRTREEA